MTDKKIVLCEIDNRGIANIHLNRPNKIMLTMGK